MRSGVTLIVILSLGFTYAQTTRETFPEVKCSDIQPVDCYDEAPAGCPPERVQTWLPLNNAGIPGTCGACFYCQPFVIETTAVDCPEAMCPEIPPTCNSVVPRTRFYQGRRCRDCSTCLSYNVCPQLDCPNMIRGCAVTGPNFLYTNGQLCQVCDVCTRYKTRSFTRPEPTPLPCPEFNVSDCGISPKCKVYQDRFANMGPGRRCQVCPECVEWRDPNDRIPTPATPTSATAAAVICADITSCAPQDEDCLETAPIHRFLDNGDRCRLCDICVRFQLDPLSSNDLTGNDSSTTPATTTTVSFAQSNQACPTLTSCPVTSSCSNNLAIRHTLVITGERCRICDDCRSNMNACPLVRCADDDCLETEIITETNDLGFECQLCECKRFRPRGGPQVGNDQTPSGTTMQVARPDIGDSEPEQVGIPQAFSACTQIIPEIRCPTLDQLACAVTIQDTITINGTQCRACHRCVTSVPNTCPNIQCPQIQCGDREDVSTGRRYRKAVSWEISDNTCAGCDECLECPNPSCSPRAVDCMAYTGTTDDEGCPSCAYCTNWRNNVANVRGSQGFFQAVSTGMCVESDRSPRPNQNHVFVNQCSFLNPMATQRQVWSYNTDGTLKEIGSGECLVYNPTSESIEMNECDHDLNSVWHLERGTRYVQFYRVVHHTTMKCLNAVGSSIRQHGTELELANCESFSIINNEWSDQWFKFEQYHTGSVQETRRGRA